MHIWDWPWHPSPSLCLPAFHFSFSLHFLSPARQSISAPGIASISLFLSLSFSLILSLSPFSWSEDWSWPFQYNPLLEKLTFNPWARRTQRASVSHPGPHCCPWLAPDPPLHAVQTVNQLAILGRLPYHHSLWEKGAHWEGWTLGSCDHHTCEPGCCKSESRWSHNWKEWWREKEELPFKKAPRLWGWSSHIPPFTPGIKINFRRAMQ